MLSVDTLDKWFVVIPGFAFIIEDFVKAGLVNGYGIEKTLSRQAWSTATGSRLAMIPISCNSGLAG